MAIQVGDKMPEGIFGIMGDSGPATLSTQELFAGKKVVLISVPGAFTPTCSAAHLPGFVVNADKLHARGVDTIACMAVNDLHVMHAWGQAQNAENITMLADGNGEYVSALGLDVDLSAGGMGVRGRRFALIVEDGTVSHIGLEEPREFEVSSAEAILTQL